MHRIFLKEQWVVSGKKSGHSQLNLKYFRSQVFLNGCSSSDFHLPVWTEVPAGTASPKLSWWGVPWEMLTEVRTQPISCSSLECPGNRGHLNRTACAHCWPLTPFKVSFSETEAKAEGPLVRETSVWDKPSAEFVEFDWAEGITAYWTTTAVHLVPVWATSISPHWAQSHLAGCKDVNISLVFWCHDDFGHVTLLLESSWQLKQQGRILLLSPFALSLASDPDESRVLADSRLLQTTVCQHCCWQPSFDRPAWLNLQVRCFL